jgi:hypothetical protein
MGAPGFNERFLLRECQCQDVASNLKMMAEVFNLKSSCQRGAPLTNHLEYTEQAIKP